MKGDSQKSVSFLCKALPLGPWALTAIATNRKSLITSTFMPGEEDECQKWIDARNGQYNIYWHINPVMDRITKKAEREDIKQVNFLHVDVDPRVINPDLTLDEKREHNKAENERIKALLEKPHKEIPRPSMVIFSGGGYQAFWRLKEPIIIDGDLEKAEEAKLYNMKLEQEFEADNCHNIDRLMRLPGTINVPNAQKKKKGRLPVMADVTWFEKTTYDIKEFKKATLIQAKGEKGLGSGQTVKISGNVRQIEDIDELNEWDIPDRVKVIAVQGRDPDNPKEKDDSRSAWLFDFICQLARRNVPDDVIYSLVTDKNYKISESVLELRGGAEKYALRQIERAKEYVIEPKLQELNERHAVISNVGGKCRAIEEIMDWALNRPKLTMQSFEDFRNRYNNQRVIVGRDEKTGQPIYKPLGTWWLSHESRRQYDTMVFAPNRDIPQAYNLWKGYACEAIEGDCGLFLAHLKENVCRNNEEHYNYLIGWAANCVQNPDSPGHSAIVMRGGMGVGKSFFAKQLGSLFGRHFLQVSNPKHLIGNFNAHLRDCVVLFGDEAFFAGDKKHESVLRTLVTEEVIAIEAKGIDVENSSNFTHVLLASNKNWIVPAGSDERRFFVVDVSEDHKQDHDYFKAIADQLDTGGREALLYMLQNYDLSNFEVRKVPKTDALNEQKLLSMTAEEEWWYDKLMDGAILRDDDEWNREVPKEALFTDYVDYMRQNNVLRRANKTTLGKFISKVCPGFKLFRKNDTVRYADASGMLREETKRVRYYCLPELKECRIVWNKLFGEQKWLELPAEQQELEIDNTPPF